MSLDPCAHGIGTPGACPKCNAAHQRAERDALNRIFHEALGVEVDPCEHGCTHLLSDRWTALGAANVLSRSDRRQSDPPCEGGCSYDCMHLDAP